MMEHERLMQKSARELFPSPARSGGKVIVSICSGCGIEFEWAHGPKGGRRKVYCTSECKTRYGSSRH
jgi:hypothetical protein